jgi:RHS repeat-associated protein
MDFWVRFNSIGTTVNLLNDGVNTYTYDAANRLKQLTQGANTYTYSYNGLGDRLVQNGVHYTLDLNTGLTQVLNDGTNTYLYGLDRVAEQQGGVNEYYLGDVLGSIRQIANNSGAITLARSYDPYGNTRQTIGDAQTNFGFTSEFTDPSGLIYLRARYYDSLTGRFTTRDTWGGDANTPASLNRFNYAHSNPVMNTDPSGHLCVAGKSFGPGRDCTQEEIERWDEFYANVGLILAKLKTGGEDAQAIAAGFLYEYTDTITVLPITSLILAGIDELDCAHDYYRFLNNNQWVIAGRYLARAVVLAQAGRIGAGRRWFSWWVYS